MPDENAHSIDHPKTATDARSWTTWALISLILIASFFLLTEHRSHLFGALPYLLLLACPLLHFFHHRGHRGGHRGGGGHDAADSKDGERP